MSSSMFSSMEMAAPDAILGLNAAFNSDENPNKINLGVGVYKDETGITPILECVKQAERMLLESENSKSYLGIDGLPEYAKLVRQTLFGSDVDMSPMVTLQTPGGTGALRVAGDFLKAKAGASRIWLSNPTWANHGAIFSAAGLATDSYRYLGECGKALDFTGMMESIAAIPAGDVICLHACCHNPTGVDPTVEQWSEIAAACATGGVLPLIDFAYQGFANGIREDAAALQPFLSSGNEFMVCSSFSKNFGLYAERVGALTIVSQDSHTAAITLSHAKTAVRTNYSNPPKHGGAIVATVLGSTELTALWESEVAAMRDRINGLRQEFVAAMVSRQCSVDFSFIQDQRGMFSFSGLNPLQVDQLRKEHSIYIVGSGRINVAGLNSSNIQVLCDAIIEVL